jgi:hypothetical protein
MFLYDPLQNRRVALAVPRTFGIDDRNRPPLADAETVGFRAKDAALFGELQLFEAPLQERPCDEATLLVAAFRFGLIAAEKNMAPRDSNTDAGRDFSLGIGHLVVRPSQIATGRSAVAPSGVAVEKMP